MNEYLLQFELRSDTKEYEKTDLREWKEVIEKSIEKYNDNGSQFNDERHLDLKAINEKDFYVQLQTRYYWDAGKRAFYNRVGSLSRYLKVHGMSELSSPHGKLFTLNVINIQIDPEIQQRKELKRKTLESGEIYVDHKNKCILIPKEWMNYYCIKFYETQENKVIKS